MNKEQVYDEQINPLMTRIIAICKENGMAMIASFSIPTDEQSDLMCTTALTDEFGDRPESYEIALNAIYKPSSNVMMITEENTDGTKRVTAILG